MSAAFRGEPAILNIPGEYSIKGVSIKGINSFHDKKEGAEQGLNTIFIIESEGIRFCHLGDLATSLDKKQIEEINGVDILAVPVGRLNIPLMARKRKQWLIRSSQKSLCRCTIKFPARKEKIEDEKKFCKEIGVCPKRKMPKLIIRKKDLGRRKDWKLC